jgi:hypothetical protein
MLHNSLYRRDLLLAMNKEPLVLRRRDVHRTVGPRPGTAPPVGWIALQGPWSIHASRNLPAEQTVVRDAEDFLKRMGVKIAPTPRG